MSASRMATGDGHYSIRVASRMTGIPADTLRVWERRYDFPRPARTATGLRVYSASDVERLSLVARALAAGFRPRDALGLAPGELREAIARTRRDEDPTATPDAIAELVGLLARDEAEALSRRLRSLAATLGPREFLLRIAGPLATAVGAGWAEGSLQVRHEHLLTDELSAQLRLLLSAHDDAGRRPIVVLATLPGELHGLGLQMAALYLALAGATSRRLGVDVPLKEIVDAADALDADAVGLSVSRSTEVAGARRYVARLAARLPARVALWLGGSGAPDVQGSVARARVLRTWSDVDRAVAALG